MHNELQFKQIHASMNPRETEELVEIWVKNDRVEWSDLTFEIIKKILQERSVETPAQNNPVYEHQPQRSLPNKLKRFMASDHDPDRFSADGDSGPIFYKPQRVLAFQKWIYLTMIIVIIAYFANAAYVIMFTQGNSRAVWLPVIATMALQIAFAVIALKGLSYVLIILMQFEFNSRATSIKKR
jgi:hypothetical protein